MEIKSKQILKIELEKQINEYVERFPIYFYGNTFAVALCLVTFVFLISFSIFGLQAEIEVLFELPLLIIVAIIQVIFSKRFWMDFNIFKKIRAGRYNFEIEDHEMDNVVEFITDLPMKRDEAERLRVALSFDESLESLEKFGIIVFEDGLCDVSLKFKFRIERAEELAGLHLG